MSIDKNKVIYVSEIMLSLDQFQVVSSEVYLKEALDKMSEYKLGIICILQENKLKGIITDGDIRRKLLNVQKPFSAFFVDDAIKHSINNPMVINEESLLLNALDVMEDNQIWDLPVVNNDGKFEGLLHLHPVVKTLLNIQS